ncbi:hypothetical protein [Leptospira sp. GIMC2001]|uniref:hypothetical protein n=1 Tax=Leptospira sp. GIMC2001 TaxID=1513297 RepID=UPI00234A18A8|nr:hypothetical protein [Leptospira sp. GIMC2001]WCL51437.1 hypothetical protein O4O04_20185 [Leptospira sp. GIMC2001]
MENDTKNTETQERRFLRGSNIWRAIGGVLTFVGIILMILFPSETYKDIVLYRSYDSDGNISKQITVWHIVIITGLLAFFPTIKELIHGFFRKGGGE